MTKMKPELLKLCDKVVEKILFNSPPFMVYPIEETSDGDYSSWADEITTLPELQTDRETAELSRWILEATANVRACDGIIKWGEEGNEKEDKEAKNV